MSTSTGAPTAAVHGFCRKLLQLEQQFADHTQIAVFDSNGPTFRSAMDADYKGNRAAMPHALSTQMDLIREGCECLGVATAEHGGVEADDIIASLVSSACAANAEQVVVVSSDKESGARGTRNHLLTRRVPAARSRSSPRSGSGCEAVVAAAEHRVAASCAPW